MKKLNAKKNTNKPEIPGKVKKGYGGHTDKHPEQTKPDHQICGAY